MIDPSSAEYTTLQAATEDDATGLYDLLWLFDSAFADDLIEERLRAAKQALRGLIGRGWLRIWFASWTSPDIESAIAGDAIAGVIENPHWWENHIDRMVWFAATEAGRQAFSQPEAQLRDVLSRPPQPTE